MALLIQQSARHLAPCRRCVCFIQGMRLLLVGLVNNENKCVPLVNNENKCLPRIPPPFPAAPQSIAQTRQLHLDRTPACPDLSHAGRSMFSGRREKHGKELAQTRNNSARSQYAAAAEHACFRTDKEALKVAGCIMKGD